MGGGVSGVVETDTSNAHEKVDCSDVLSGVISCGASSPAIPTAVQPVIARQPGVVE
jgi:hypothetical protein